MTRSNDFSTEEAQLKAELEALIADLGKPNGLLTPGLPLYVLSASPITGEGIEASITAMNHAYLRCFQLSNNLNLKDC